MSKVNKHYRRGSGNFKYHISIDAFVMKERSIKTQR